MVTCENDQIKASLALGSKQHLVSLPLHRENMEFGCSFFQTGKTPGICQKNLKYVFAQGIYLQHRDKFGVLKIKGCTRIVVGNMYNLLALKQILSWGQLNSGIKCLQQALLYLKLWFKVYIGSSVNPYEQWQ